MRHRPRRFQRRPRPSQQAHDPYWNEHEALEDLPLLLRDEIEQFFSIYKDLEGKTVTIAGWFSLEEATREIAAARERLRWAGA